MLCFRFFSFSKGVPPRILSFQAVFIFPGVGVNVPRGPPSPGMIPILQGSLRPTRGRGPVETLGTSECTVVVNSNASTPTSKLGPSCLLKAKDLGIFGEKNMGKMGTHKHKHNIWVSPFLGQWINMIQNVTVCLFHQLKGGTQFSSFFWLNWLNSQRFNPRIFLHFWRIPRSPFFHTDPWPKAQVVLWKFPKNFCIWEGRCLHQLGAFTRLNKNINKQRLLKNQ